MKIQNNFTNAIINKDLDERLTPNGSLIDAENFMVTSEDNSNAGVGKNVFGNTQMTNLGIVGGGTTIGAISDDSKDRIFYFHKGISYDYVIEYSLLANIPVIVLQSSTFGSLNFSTSHRIHHSNIFTSVEGDDLLSWTDGLNPPRIINIDKSKLYPINGFSSAEISVIKAPPLFAPETQEADIVYNPNNVNIESNEIEDRFCSFAYRWKYEDGYFSSLSPFSEYYFLPDNFNLDYDTLENLGMINQLRNLNIKFNTGKRDVIGVDVLVKYSGDNKVFIIDKFLKADEGWGNEEIRTILFSNNKIYAVLPESQFTRSFDNVPLIAKTQEKIGNRLVYGNYLEGRDLVDVNEDKLLLDYGVDFVFGDTSTETLPIELSSSIYNLTTPSFQVDETLITITFPPNKEFEIGNKLFFKFNIKPKGDYAPTFFFEEEFFYQVNENYASLNALFLNSSLVGFLEGAFSTTFRTELEYVTALGVIDAFVGFKVLNPTANTLTIQIPAARYLSSAGNSATTQIGVFNFADNVYTYSGGATIDWVSINLWIKVLETNIDITTQVYLNGILFETVITNSGLIPNALLNLWSLFDATPATTSFAGNYTFVLSYSSPVTITQVYLEALGEDTSIPLNPIALRDYIEGFSIIGLSTGFVAYFRNQSFSALSDIIGRKTSMKSDRSYEVAMIYKDKEGRKTTALTSEKNTVYIPVKNSITQNKLRVTIPVTQKPPSWADSYKFVVKQNRVEYNTIIVNKYYTQGQFRWFKLEGENKSKVKEGDLLVAKRDMGGALENLVKVKVLEVKSLKEGEITNIDGWQGLTILSEEGLYFKIKSKDLNLITQDVTSYLFTKDESTLDDRPIASLGIWASTPTPTRIPIPAGTQIRLFFDSFRSGRSDAKFDETFIVNGDYFDFSTWWVDNMVGQDLLANTGENYKDNITVSDGGITGLVTVLVKGIHPGNGNNRRGYLKATITIISSTSFVVFENEPEKIENEIFYETPETYRVINNAHQQSEHILSRTYNCFTFNNGVESSRYRDSFVQPQMYLDFFPTAVSEDEYKQTNRYADLTYSGVYQENTNVNKLNEFNLSLANYKEDMEKSYGEIIRLDADETDLLVIQEDKWSKVLYGKDLLYNTDATTNLTRIDAVLGQQVMYGGEYGISKHPESYIKYGFNAFSTDAKRGVVLSLNNSNGLREISSFGFTDYFKKLFRDNVIENIISEYDSFYDTYILNIKYNKNKYVTWLYSPIADGFLTRVTFNPDCMISSSNNLISFKGGEVYLHNKNASRNTFYGVTYPSKFSFNFSQDPSTRKTFKNISIEGTDSWDIKLKTDLQDGYIGIEDFKKKEGVHYAYVRGNNNSLDTATMAFQGIGEIESINYIAPIITMKSNVENIISIGDLLYNSSLTLIGVIENISGKIITLDTTIGLNVNDFVVAVKPQSIETSGLLGYYMRVDCEKLSPNHSEVFSVNSDVVKSFE